MKLPRVRWTVRRMMALIAAVGVSLGAVHEKQRHDLRKWHIRYHGMMEGLSTARASHPSAFRGGCIASDEAVPRLATDPCRDFARAGANPGRQDYLRDAAYHGRMRQYYQAMWW